MTSHVGTTSPVAASRASTLAPSSKAAPDGHGERPENSPAADGLATIRESHGPVAEEGEKARIESTRSSAHQLPFHVQLMYRETPVPKIGGFGVRFSEACVTTGRSGGENEPHYRVHLEGALRARHYDLRLRYDGHHSRAVVLARRGQTQESLSNLMDEWSDVAEGLHELVVFARDDKGVVPVTPDGQFAYATCRFEVDARGLVRILPPRESNHDLVLLGPEGTLHGQAGDAAVLQVGGELGKGHPRLSVERPDGGREVHELTQNSLELTPLASGDYRFVLFDGETNAGGSQLGTGRRTGRTLGYAQSITVNRE